MYTRTIEGSLRAVLCTSLLVALFAIGLTRDTPRAQAAGDCNINETVDAEEQAFLKLINQHRAQNGRAPLGLSYTLSRAAAWKSKDLGVNAYFAHDDLNRTRAQRIRDCGYRYNTYLGENIAAGVSSAQAAFDLWKNSSGHNANMLGSNYTTIGIGREYVVGSPYGWYWTTEFGGVDDGYATIAQPAPVAPLPQPDAGGDEQDETPPELSLRVRGKGRTLTVTANASDAGGVERVAFWADGVLVKTDRRAPYEARIRVPRRGTSQVEARAYDPAGNLTIERVTVGAQRR
ncbi:MAG: CAP domain-containing protein [Dehalococcoidia bacterium]